MNRLYWLIAATFPVAIVSALSWFGVFTFVNGYLIRELGGSNADWTVATLWMSGGMLFWYPAFTGISARIGRRRTVTLALIAATLAYVGIAFSHSVFLINLWLALMGAAVAAYLAAWSPFAAEVGGDRPRQALALTMFVLNLVGAAVLLGGGCLAGSKDYRLMFLVFSAVCGACVLLFHVLARHLETVMRTHADDHGGCNKPASILSLSGNDLGGLVRGPFLVVILLGISAAPFAFHTANQLFPNLSRDLHGLSETQMATLVALGRIPSLFTLFAVSRIVDRLNVVRLYGAGLVCDGLTIAAVASTPTAGLTAAAYLAFHLLHGIVWGAALPAVDACVPPRLRDSAFAITGMIEVTAIFFVGLIHNRLVVTGFALDRVFLVCGIIPVLGGTALFLYSHASHSKRVMN